VEAGQVAVAGQDLEMRALPKPNRGFEVADDERDRLAVVAVGGVPDQPGACICVCGDDHGYKIVRESGLYAAKQRLRIDLAAHRHARARVAPDDLKWSSLTLLRRGETPRDIRSHFRADTHLQLFTQQRLDL